MLHNSKNAYRDSSKLEGHLNDYCLLVDKNLLKNKHKLSGIYYRFISDNAVLISLEEALTIVGYENAIFSIHPGKLGFYFSHEDRVWLCQK